MARIKVETEKRTNFLVQQELYDKNLIKAINRTVIPVAGYVMNVCIFTKQKLDELDKEIKQILRENKMHGKQASDERLHMRRENGGRGLKSMKDLYEETKVRVACYMTHSESAWTKTAWRREFQKDGKSINSEAEDALSEFGENIQFCLDHVKVQESLLSRDSVWYKQKWSKGTVLEKNGKKVCWDF